MPEVSLPDGSIVSFPEGVSSQFISNTINVHSGAGGILHSILNPKALEKFRKPAAEMFADVMPGIGHKRAIDRIREKAASMEEQTPIGKILSGADIAGEGAGFVADVIPGLKTGALAVGALAPVIKKAAKLPTWADEIGDLPEGGASLLVQHKLTPDNLRNADKMGGLPMPSVAVTRVDTPMEGYGGITLVGNKNMAKPAGRNPVYSADAYSPTYPSIDYRVSKNKVDRLNDRLSTARELAGGYKLSSESFESGAESLKQSTTVMAKYLEDMGIKPRIPDGASSFDRGQAIIQKVNEVGKDKFRAYADEMFNSLYAEERIFDGFTNMGYRRYKPHTIDNVVKIMKREMRDNNQTSMFGSGALRAQVAPKFRNISEVKAARGRIKPPKDLDKIKDSLNERLIDISHKFDEYSTYTDRNPFIAGDVNRERLLEIAQGYTNYDEYFPGAPQNIIDEWESYLSDLKDAPTGYFEVKPQRAVSLDEFQGAIVPSDTPKDVIDILQKSGLRIEKYSDESSEKAARIKFKDLMFGGAAASVGLTALEDDKK